jgi:hypothetical protein
MPKIKNLTTEVAEDAEGKKDQMFRAGIQGEKRLSLSPLPGRSIPPMVFPGTTSALSVSSSFPLFSSSREDRKAKRIRFSWNHLIFLSLPRKISAASACSAVDICSSAEGTENFIIS